MRCVASAGDELRLALRAPRVALRHLGRARTMQRLAPEHAA